MITLRPALLRQHWRAILRGAEGAVFSQADIDSDGRTRAKSIRTLLEEGVIAAVEGDYREPHYGLAPKYIATLEPGSKPDLALIAGVATLPDYRLRLLGVALEAAGAQGVTMPEYRHIAEHRGEYTFTDAWGKVIDPTASGAPWDLLVRDAAFDAAITARELVIDTERATKKNLVWGLNRVGAMPEVQTRELAVFRPRSDDLLGASEIAFGDDPGQWEKDAEDVIRQLRERIAQDTHALSIVTHVNGFIRGRGGWGAFVDEYTIAIAERIAEKTTPAPAPTGADAPDAAGNPAAGTLAEVFARDDARLLREKAGG